MAAAAFLIRDADVPGNRITIFERFDRVGRNINGSGTPADGYVLPGGRVLDEHYVCTYDLFSSIPSLDRESSVTDEIQDWNRSQICASRSSLFRAGRRLEHPLYALGERDILALELLAIEPERSLGAFAISDVFEQSFFETDFWVMWSTTFGFQPWHSAVEFRRHLLRFMQMIDGFNELRGVTRTIFNPYDSLVRPLRRWLRARGVRFELNTWVCDLRLEERDGGLHVRGLVHDTGGERSEICVTDDDLVFVTLGSMTDGSTYGSMTQPPPPVVKATSLDGAWALWTTLAAKRSGFGRPTTFTNHIDESKWTSFTATLRDPTFLELVRQRAGDAPGEIGLLTFADSNWRMSIAVPHQPHFFGQPDGVHVCWGYGLAIDRPGNFVAKPMSGCSGHDILREILGHLRIESESERILASSTVIPSLMPFITSQFLRRNVGDRPPVVPRGSHNLAFLGQFCELPRDVSFTVEYSVRSAQMAVYQLLGLKRALPPVYTGRRDSRSLVRAFSSTHHAGTPLVSTA